MINTDSLIKNQVEPIDPITALTYSDVPFGKFKNRVDTSFLKEDISPSDVPFRYSKVSPTYSDIDVNEYSKYLGTVYPTLGERYLNKARAQNQSGTEQFVGFLNQALVGEIGGGTIEGIGHLLDIVSTAKALSGTEKEFGNWFTEIGKSMRTWSEEATPIYRDPDAPKFDPGSWSWWMQNGKSVASTVSLMIPSGLAIRGISAVGKAIGAFSKVTPMASMVTKGLGQAAISRHMENMMEASGVYEESYDSAISKGLSIEEAQEYAAKAASRTYALDWAMFLQDVPQYMLLHRSFGKANIGAADKSIKAAKAMGHDLLPVVGKKSAAIGWDMVTEGFEEGYQFIAAEEGKYLADKLHNPSLESSFDERLDKYIRDGELWTNVTMGALGAGVMQTAGKKINQWIQGGDQQEKFVKDFGSRISNAADQIRMADVMDSESGKRVAVSNLQSTLYEKAAALGQMEDLKEMLRRSSNPSPEDLERFNISPEDLVTLNNEESLESLIQDADQYTKRWEANTLKYNARKAADITTTEFLIDKFDQFKKDYNNRLEQLLPDITNFYSLSQDAQSIVKKSSDILSLRKKIDFQKQRVEKSKTPLSKPEKDLIENIIKVSEKLLTSYEKELTILQEDQKNNGNKEKDDSVDIGAPYNLLDIKDPKDVTNHRVSEYIRTKEAATFADDTLKSAQQRLKDILSDKIYDKTPKGKEEDKDNKKDTKQVTAETDDYVLYTKDGVENTGIVDSIDEKGNYVIIPTVKWSDTSKYANKPQGDPITVPADKVKLDVKQYSEENLTEETIAEEDLTPNDIDTKYKGIVEPFLDISYMQDDDTSTIPKVRNEELNKFLSDPTNDLVGVEALLSIDTTSQFAVSYFKENGLSDIEIRKIQNGKLTDNDIKDLFESKTKGAKYIGKTYSYILDTLPIEITIVKNGIVLFKGGLYYHDSNYGKVSVPDFIKQQGPIAEASYQKDQRLKTRKARRFILTNLLKGNEVYSSSLKKVGGHFNNFDESGNRTWGSVIDRHGLKVKDSKLAVARGNGRVYLNGENTLSNLSSNNPGAIFANVHNTPDGKEKWAKVNPSKLTIEHAEILWDAIKIRYTNGKGGRMAAFPDSRVEGLSVGDVIDMLVLFGDKKTNPKHPDNKLMKDYVKNKALFVSNGNTLTFGEISINLHEDDIKKDQANKENFVKWVTNNKNYSVSLSVKSLGLDLNKPFNREFKIGKWSNKTKKAKELTFAQLLMTVPVDGKSKYAVVTDLQPVGKEGNKTTLVRPSLLLGDTLSDIKTREPADIVAKQQTKTDTKETKNKKEVVDKLKKDNELTSATDFVNLPSGSIIYYEGEEYQDGKIIGKENNTLAYIKYDKVVGRWLDLNPLKGTKVYDEYHGMPLDGENNFKKIEAFIAYLKKLPHIPSILVDVSNTVEDKRQEPIKEDKGETTIDKGVESLEDIFDGEPLSFDQDNKEPIINLEKELKWLYNKFGKDQVVKETDKLIKLASSGKLAYSVFTVDAIYVFTGAPEGAIYHEAFHRVLLGYLSIDDRAAIYNSARKLYNLPNATEYELSEKLAEDFRSYKLANTKPKSRTIGQLFKDLFNFIYTFFTGNTKLNSFEVEKLFEAIERGQFKYSKISKNNRELLGKSQTPMAIDIRRQPVSIITNYSELDTIVKFLTATLIQVNNIESLNDIENIKMNKLFDSLGKKIDSLNSMILTTENQLSANTIAADKITDIKNRLEISKNLLSVLTLVNSEEYKSYFVGKVSDMLRKLNVNMKFKEGEELDTLIENDYVHDWDAASYEVNTKDNILASVKFLIATLPKNGILDPHIGIYEYVDFNEMWSSLMYNLHNISTVEEMISIIQSKTDIYSYNRLLDKLNKDTSGLLKQQLFTSVSKHKHSFVNFLISLDGKGIPTIAITNADVSNASRRTINDWNTFLYNLSILVKVDGLHLNSDHLAQAYNRYIVLRDKVNKEYSKAKLLDNKASIMEELVSVLSQIGIDIKDTKTIEKLIESRVSTADNSDDALRLIIDNDLSYTFGRIKSLTAGSKDLRKMYSDEKYIQSLANAFIESHPELISDMVLGPNGNQYFVYSQNSYTSDKVKRFKKDKQYLKDHLDKLYNNNSFYGQQLLSDDVALNDLALLTFSMVGKGNSVGLDYLDINPIEDYVFKLTALANGLIPFPTMADRKTFYLLKGLKPYEFKPIKEQDGTFKIPEDVVNIMLGYAKSEKDRIDAATDLIEKYNIAKESNNVDRIKEIEDQMVVNYHYILRGDIKDTSKASAIKYHHFPSFNKEGFNFDTDAKSAIKIALSNNILAELNYAEELGVIASTVVQGKKYYYNQLLDKTLVDKYKSDYGTEDLAIKAIMASNFINTAIATVESEKLFSGDPAYFKVDKDTKGVMEDKIKRSSVLPSTGDNFSNTVEDQGLVESDINVVGLNTQKYQSPYYTMIYEWYTNATKNKLLELDQTLTEEKAIEKAKIISTDALSAYRELDPTDGQAWISPELYRGLSIRLGEWSNDKETAFHLLTSGKELSLEEEKLSLKVTFQPLKLVYFDLLHDGNLAIPTYHKASFTTIFRSMGQGKFGDRQIMEMLDRMEQKGKYTNTASKVDMFVMDSATKVGGREKSYFLDKKLENVNDLSNITVYAQPMRGFRRQLVTDTHDTDRTKTGTQFLKVIMANLELDKAVYTLPGYANKVTGAEIRDIIFNSLNSLSDRGRAELNDKLGFENGKINKAKLIETLIEDAKQSNASEDLIEALNVEKSDNVTQNDLYLELDSLTEHKWIQSRLISLISKYTIDVTLPGNQFIQFSNLGIRSINKEYNLEEAISKNKHFDWITKGTDDLQWMTLEDGKVIPMGAIVSINLFKHIIPNYENISYKEKLKYVKDNPDIIGYRIPTQGQNSMFALRIIGIYPETIGDTITLPSEFTGLTGSDFDIDKIFLVRYNYNVKKDGTLEKIKFIEGDTNDSKVLSQVYKSKYGKISNVWKYLIRIINASSVEFSTEEKGLLFQIKEMADNSEIEYIVDSLLEGNKYDGLKFNKLADLIKYESEADFISKNKGKNIYELNNKKAVQNKMLDAFFSVLLSEEHYISTAAPLGNLAKRLKNKANYIRSAKVSQIDDMYYLSPRFQEAVKLSYTGGKGGIGPFALNNVHHILAQLANLSMKSTSAGILHETKDGQIDLSKKYAKDNETLISNWISALIDAHVDVAKDPYIVELNVNYYTWNAVTLLIRGGLGEEAFDFIAQPILVELANVAMLSNKNNVLRKKLFIETGVIDPETGKSNTEEVTDPIKYVRNKWLNKLSNKEIEELNKSVWHSGFSDKLYGDLIKSSLSDVEFVRRQLQVLKTFEEFNERGKKLNSLVQASQIDTKKFGNSIVDLYSFLNKIGQVYEEDAFNNLEEVLPFNPSTNKKIQTTNANFLGTYTDNSINFALKVFSDLSIVATPVFRELYDKLLLVSGNTNTYDNKLTNILTDEIFSALVSRFFTHSKYAGLDNKKLLVLMNSVANKVGLIRQNVDGKYDDLQNNAFIKMIQTIASNNEDELFPVNQFIAVSMKDTKDKLDKDNIINGFKELIKHDRKEINDLGRQLFFYAFFTSGYRNRIYSFFNVIPNDLFKEIQVKDPSDPSKFKPISYNQMIKDMRIHMQNLENIISYKHIIDEVLINNHDNDNIVKFIKRSLIKEGYDTFKNKKYDFPIAIKLSFFAHRQLFLGTNLDNKPVYRPYIKVHNEKLGHILYRYIGYELIQGDKGIVSFNPIYAATNMRSYNNRAMVVKEFNLDKSIVNEYNQLSVIKLEEEEAFMDSIKATHISKDSQVINLDKSIVDLSEVDTVEKEQPIVQMTKLILYQKQGQRLQEVGTTLSTIDKPLVIFVDGSDNNKQSANNVLGYGAWFNYNGTEYALSGTTNDVERILSQFKGVSMSNPTMELLGLLDVLNRFKTTKEHILVRQDYSGAVNYTGLWDYSVGSAQRADKPWQAKEPYIKYIVEEINKAIKEIENNGGSVKIQWVPGHIDNNKISKYENIFKGEDGTISQAIIDDLTNGNNMADVYAKMTESIDTISDLLSGTVKPEVVQPDIKPEEFVDHSGGAIGADSIWEDYGKEYGVINYNHYYHGNKTPRGNVEITNEQLEEGWRHVLKANKTLNRKPNAYKDLLSRNWMQVKNADEVFAISSIDFTENIVRGGTGWAVQMAIDAGKIVHVFDQETNHWYITEYDEDNDFMGFAEEDTPVLTKNFAGIGSRNITESGKQAIKNVYEKTFNTVKSESDMFGQLSLFDKINDITDEQAEERKKECE